MKRKTATGKESAAAPAVATNQRNKNALQLDLDTEFGQDYAAVDGESEPKRGLYVSKKQSEKTPHMGSFGAFDCNNSRL